MIPIVKNNSIKVSCKDGSVVLARVVSVKENTINADASLVSWKSLDGEWKGKAYLKHCVKMTPLECAEAAKAHEAKFAPVHPIMEKWMLGTTKRGPQMMEGYYFAIGVYRNNKKVGEVIEEGNGGPVITRFNDPSLAHAFAKDCTEWCRVNGASMAYLEAEAEYWNWYDNARPKSKDAVTFFKEKNEERATWAASVKPIHTGNLALVEGKI